MPPSWASLPSTWPRLPRPPVEQHSDPLPGRDLSTGVDRIIGQRIPFGLVLFVAVDGEPIGEHAHAFGLAGSGDERRNLTSTGE